MLHRRHCLSLLTMSIRLLSSLVAAAWLGAAPACAAPPARGLYLATWEGLQALERLPGQRVDMLLLAFLRLCGPQQLSKDQSACEGKAVDQLNDGALERAFDARLGERKRHEPALQVLASIGGWGGSDPFFAMAAAPARRSAFVADAQRFLREHPAIDGLDIDWEHPGGNGAANGVALGGPADGANFVQLLRDLRAGLEALGAETGRRYALTVAVNVQRPVLARVDWRAAAPLLDRLFMMSYDYHGAWDARTGHQTALRGAGRDDSLEESLQHLDAAGFPRAKLMAGAAFYGRAWAGVHSPEPGAPGQGPGLNADGAAGWRELRDCCIGADGRGRGGFIARHDAARGADSLWHPQRRVWISFESPASVRAKRAWVVAQGLGGLFAWESTQDNGELLEALSAR